MAFVFQDRGTHGGIEQPSEEGRDNEEYRVQPVREFLGFGRVPPPECWIPGTVHECILLLFADVA